MSAYPARGKLPADLRSLQRACVRRHNLCVVGLTFCTFCPTSLILYFFGYTLGRVAVPGAMVTMAATLIVGVVLIQRTNARFSRRIGFVCPACGQPLYAASSAFGSYSRLVTRGECPHCRHPLASHPVPRA